MAAGTKQSRAPGPTRRRRSAPACLALALLALGCEQDRGAGGPRPSTAPGPELDPRPNLVLVTLDTLRADHTGPHGYAGSEAGAATPFLDRLAARGTLFERAYSTSSWTAPATASIFTGLYPNQHGVIAGFRAHARLARPDDAVKSDESGGPVRLPGRVHERMELVRLPESLPTLVERLSAAGYTTFGIATNLNIGSELGFDRGFDEFERMYKSSAEEVAARLGEWRARFETEAPWFLYLHLNDVHKPYVGRPDFGFDGGDGVEAEEDESFESARRRYASEVRYLDHWLGRMHDELGWDLGWELGSWPGTLVLVVSDHGEEFGDHGSSGHRYSLHAEVNDALMVLAGPGVASGRRVASGTSLVDVLPTLLEAAGLELPAGLPGGSLLSLAGSGGEPAHFTGRALFAHRIQGNAPEPLLERPPLWSIVEGRWKLIVDQRRGRAQLFDVVADPGETEDLSQREAERAARMRARLDEFVEQSERLEGGKVEIEVDEELLRTLEELGYAGHD